MNPLEHEISALRWQLEANNSVLAELVHVIDRLGSTIEQFVRAIPAEQDGDDPTLTLLKLLLSMSREQKEMLIALGGQGRAPC